jgi:hypothetical protein
MRRLIARRVVPIFAVLAVAIGIVGSPAHAAYADCTSGWVCLFDSTNGTTKIWEGVAAPGTCVYVGDSDNDRGTSFINRLFNGRRVQFYENYNCTGHAMHRAVDNYGGSTQPFPSGFQGNFQNIDYPHWAGCGTYPTDHCDNNKTSAVFFNNG